MIIFLFSCNRIHKDDDATKLDRFGELRIGMSLRDFEKLNLKSTTLADSLKPIPTEVIKNVSNVIINDTIVLEKVQLRFQGQKLLYIATAFKKPFFDYLIKQFPYRPWGTVNGNANAMGEIKTNSDTISCSKELNTIFLYSKSFKQI
jgi:hypothetical protein